MGRGKEKMTDLKVDNLAITVVKKSVKNLRLSVCSSDGRIKISAPLSMSLSAIKSFVIAKLAWIEKQQCKFRAQRSPACKQFATGESHFFNGKTYVLQLEASLARPQVSCNETHIIMQINPAADCATKIGVLNNWYTQQLNATLALAIPVWEKRMGVCVAKYSVRKMKTKWGSCTPALGTIRFNLELAKKSRDLVEYVVVHELAHLLEPSHNHRFKAIMDNFVPDWRSRKQELNRLALGE